MTNVHVWQTLIGTSTQIKAPAFADAIMDSSTMSLATLATSVEEVKLSASTVNRAFREPIARIIWLTLYHLAAVTGAFASPMQRTLVLVCVHAMKVQDSVLTVRRAVIAKSIHKMLMANVNASRTSRCTIQLKIYSVFLPRVLQDMP